MEQHEPRCFQFYEGLTYIIESLAPGDIQGLKAQLETLILDLAQFIYKREIKEMDTHQTDNLLIGKMRLLRALL